FDGFGFSGTGWAKQQKHTHRTALGSQARLEHLDVRHNHACYGGLADNLLRKNSGQVLHWFNSRLPRTVWSAFRLIHPSLSLDYIRTLGPYPGTSDLWRRL